MKILCDVHIALKTVRFFEENGVEAQHVNRILDKWRTKDSDIARHADKNDYIVLTKDADFQATHLLNLTPKKLIRLVLGNISTEKMIELLKQNLILIQQLNEQDHFFLEIDHFESRIIR
jgi:predicted nuclease of predicted toxin-antitoxin system